MPQASSRVCKIKQLKKTFIQWCLQKGSKRHVGSDQESVVSTKRSYGLGNAIFGKYDPDKLVEDGPTDNSTDEDGGDTEDEDEDYEEDEDEDDEDEEGEDEEEEDVSRKTKKHKIRPWDVLVNIAAENLKDTFNETVEETLAGHQNKDNQEAEEMTYEELKQNYLSQLVSRYKYMVGVTAALKKDPVHQRIMKTAKRLREEEDYDDEESMQYAIKKRKFLIERKLDELIHQAMKRRKNGHGHYRYPIKHQ